jgi:hypothetical protein
MPLTEPWIWESGIVLKDHADRGVGLFLLGGENGVNSFSVFSNVVSRQIQPSASPGLGMVSTVYTLPSLDKQARSLIFLG